jgi:ribosomal protein S18 acetylase RimI-like enzyme
MNDQVQGYMPPHGGSATLQHTTSRALATVRCTRMSVATSAFARTLLGEFLQRDEHYLASASAYGEGGVEALDRALQLFLIYPPTGFVWLAFAAVDGVDIAVGACVVCRAISTSRGSFVAKLDDVTVAREWQGRGVGRAMLQALEDELRREGITRIDCGCHRANAGAWRFYEQLGYRPLDEERLARLL